MIRDLDLRAGITQYYFDARRFGPTIDDRVETTVERFVAKLADAGLSPADGAADERILSVLRNRDDIVAELKNVRHRAASQLDRHAVITSLAIALVDRIDAAVD